MEVMVKHGDRAGYDVTYFAMTGNDAVAGEAQVSTFSERPGSVAFGANRLMQEAFKDFALAGQTTYRGIYFLSQEVALHGFDAVRENVTNGGTGLLSNDKYFDSATQAWVDGVNQNYFPGNLIIAAGGWDASKSLSGGATAIIEVRRILLEFGQNLEQQSAIGSNDPLLESIRKSSNPGILASALASWVGASITGGATFGKTDANIASQGRIEGPGNFGLYITEGRVVAATGGSTEGFLAGALAPLVQGMIGAFVVSSGPFAGLNGGSLSAAIAAHVNSLITAPVGPTPDPTMFSEFLAPVGGNGDTQTSSHFPYPDTDAATWSAVGTGNKDVLYASSGTADGGGGDDLIFGRDTTLVFGGKDDLKGGAGDDIVWGKGGDDKLDGGDGNDILRGGSENDTLKGGKGNDRLDGGDITTTRPTDGTDKADYTSAAHGVTADGTTLTADEIENGIIKTSDDGDGGQDTLFSIEEVYLPGVKIDDGSAAAGSAKINLITKYEGQWTGVKFFDSTGASQEDIITIKKRASADPITPNGQATEFRFAQEAANSQSKIKVAQDADLVTSIDNLLFIDGKQLLGGAEFDFDIGDMITTSGLPYKALFGPEYPANIITQDWFAGRAESVDRLFQSTQAILGSGDAATPALGASGLAFGVGMLFGNLMIYEADRWNFEWREQYHRHFIGQSREEYIVSEADLMSNTAQTLTINFNNAFNPSDLVITIENWKNGDFGIRLDNKADKKGYEVAPTYNNARLDGITALDEQTLISALQSEGLLSKPPEPVVARVAL
ncbi:MAG: hypothetical protein ABL893_09780, partial [Hyphomicrobium sp.]